MTLFSPGQLLILLVYVLTILIIGIWPSKRLNSREAFLISGRQLSGAGSGMTIAASKIGGGLLVTYSTIFFAFGWSAAWLFVGNVAGYMIFYLFALKIIDQSHEGHYYTMADYFADRFGKKVGLAVGFLSVLSLGGWILTNLVAGSHLLSTLSGWPLSFAMASMVILITTYLVVGGFHSVVKTDWIQYGALFIIFALITFLIITPEFSFTVPNIQEMPVGQIVGFFVLGALFPFGSVELWQRVYATRNRKSLLLAIGIASMSFVVLAVLLSIVSSAVAGLPSVADLPNSVRLPVGVASMLSPGLAALWFLVFASAIISSADTFIYTTSASLVQDIFTRVGIVGKHNTVKVLRWSIVCLAALGFGIGMLFPDVVAITFLFVGFTLVLAALGIIYWRFPTLSSIGLLLACAVGFLVTIGHGLLSTPSVLTGLLAFGSTALTIGLTEAIKRLRT